MLQSVGYTRPTQYGEEPCSTERPRGPALALVAPPDDLDREVYCVQGIPLDAVGMQGVSDKIKSAVATGAPYLISTINLNFLINSLSNSTFRASLLRSNLCSADGMPVVWLAKLLGIPVRERIAGSDLFDALKAEYPVENPLRVFFFGSGEGTAAAASDAINSTPSGLKCVGSIYPGFGSVNELSTQELIDAINASGADFLAVSLGAEKGQAWLLKNHDRLTIPVRSHLGATINFQAGIIKRAPTILRKLGLEWLWRIKEEPYLWKRYAYDGVSLLYLLLMRVIPLIIGARWRKLRAGRDRIDLFVTQALKNGSFHIGLAGAATSQNIGEVVSAFRKALADGRTITIDLANTTTIDARFIGLLLMLRKQAEGRGLRLKITGVSGYILRKFRQNSVGFLLCA